MIKELSFDHWSKNFVCFRLRLAFSIKWGSGFIFYLKKQIKYN